MNPRDRATARRADRATARPRDALTARRADRATARPRDHATARPRDQATARRRDRASPRARSAAHTLSNHHVRSTPKATTPPESPSLAERVTGADGPSDTRAMID